MWSHSSWVYDRWTNSYCNCIPIYFVTLLTDNMNMHPFILRDDSFNYSSYSSWYGRQCEKTCLRGFANNTGTDQPVHPRSLISAFVIRLLESIICKLATDKISIFKLVSVAEETGLKLALSDTPKTGFLPTRPIYESFTYSSYLSWYMIALLTA